MTEYQAIDPLEEFKPEVFLEKDAICISLNLADAQFATENLHLTIVKINLFRIKLDLLPIDPRKNEIDVILEREVDHGLSRATYRNGLLDVILPFKQEQVALKE